MVIAGIIVLILVIYLGFVLINPEKF
ncbi:K(+)-transporting ATPase subunit F [Aneurinibacillus soli]